MFQTTLPNYLLLLGMLSAAYTGNLLAWLTVWTWRKARFHDASAKSTPHRESAPNTRRSDVPRLDPESTSPRAAVVERASAEMHNDLARPPAPRSNRVLVGPPMVGEATLRDWAIHYTQRTNIWESFVTDFYEAAASDPDVLQVFKDAAARRGIGAGELVADVQNHFLRALLILTHVGLTEKLAATLAEKHARLGLTPYIFDRTADALVQTATHYGVPDGAMRTLVKMVTELKPRLVTA